MFHKIFLEVLPVRCFLSVAVYTLEKMTGCFGKRKQKPRPNGRGNRMCRYFIVFLLPPLNGRNDFFLMQRALQKNHYFIKELTAL